MAPRQPSPEEMADLSSLFLKMAHDPKTRPYVASLVAQVNPERAASSFSDVAVQNRLNQFEQKIKEVELRSAAKDFERQKNKDRDELISSGRYTKEQTDEIAEIMKKNGLTDWKIGSIVYAHDHGPSEAERLRPVAGERGSATWEFPTVNGRDGKPLAFADFIKNPTAAATNAAYQIIDEFKARRPAFR